MAWYLLQSRFKGDDHDIGRFLERNREVYELFDKNKPLLVTFSDINDPSSVKKVDPYDLESHFGAGVKLKRITLEITDESVSEGRVEKVLGKEFFKRWGAVHKEALGRGGIRDQYFKSFQSTINRSHFMSAVK